MVDRDKDNEIIIDGEYLVADAKGTEGTAVDNSTKMIEEMENTKGEIQVEAEITDIVVEKEKIDKYDTNIKDIEDTEEKDMVKVDIIDSKEEIINPDYEEGEDSEEITGGILELLKSPIGKLLVKQGSEALIMNAVKKQISKEIAAKGSDFIVDNLLKINNTKKRRVRGRKRRKLLAQQEKQQLKAKEDLRKFLEHQLTNLF